MIEFLVSMLCAGIIIWIVKLILDMIPLPPPIKTIVYLIVGLILLVWFLDYAGIYHLNLNKGVRS